jgi:hypothetical protein
MTRQCSLLAYLCLACLFYGISANFDDSVLPFFRKEEGAYIKVRGPMVAMQAGVMQQVAVQGRADVLMPEFVVSEATEFVSTCAEMSTVLFVATHIKNTITPERCAQFACVLLCMEHTSMKQTTHRK